jgi:hypothetical protein
VDSLSALRRLLWFIVGLLLSAVIFAPSAHAYNATGTPSTSGTPGSIRYSWRTYPGDPGSNTLVDNETHLSATSLCQSAFTAAKCVTMNGAGTYTWDSLGSGTYCYYKKNGGAVAGCGSAWSYVKNPQACPTGYTNVGGTCTITTYTCPNGGTLSGSVCTCGPGTTDTGTACVPGCLPSQRLAGTTCVCDAGPASQGANSDLSPIPYTYEYGMTKEQWAAAPSTVSGGCQGGCATTGAKSAYVSGTGFYAVSKTGATCTTDTIPTAGATAGSGASNDEANCLKSGGSPGTVGGLFKCLPKSTVDGERVGTPSTNTKVTVNPDGSRTEVTTTQTPTTICMAGSCQTVVNTTTTTTFNTGGTPTGTTTETTTNTNPGGSGGGGSGPGGPCDPSKEQCGEDSSFGGSCAAGFVCNGDAVTCAFAKEQHLRNCQTLEPRTGGATAADAGTFYDANSKGEGITKAGNPALITDGVLPTIDQTTRGLGAASLSDQTFTLWGGQTFTLPFASLNTALGYLGSILVAVALIIAARIFHSGATA